MNTVFLGLFILHIYLSIRFAFLSSFRYADQYNIGLILLVVFIPFIRYFLSTRYLTKKTS